MAKSTGKVREKSGNFVSPEKWEPCFKYYELYKVEISICSLFRQVAVEPRGSYIPGSYT